MRDDSDLPPRWHVDDGIEYHDDWYITWGLPRRRPQPLFMPLRALGTALSPFVWVWRLLERVYWQVRGWPN
jgi:hypothetical protein